MIGLLWELWVWCDVSTCVIRIFFYDYIFHLVLFLFFFYFCILFHFYFSFNKGDSMKQPPQQHIPHLKFLSYVHHHVIANPLHRKKGLSEPPPPLFVCCLCTASYTGEYRNSTSPPDSLSALASTLIVSWLLTVSICCQLSIIIPNSFLHTYNLHSLFVPLSILLATYICIRHQEWLTITNEEKGRVFFAY